MNRVKPFPKELRDQILRNVDAAMAATPSQSHFAAFDADGTLWDSDVGENFFQYQIDHCNLPALQGISPWDHYLGLKKQHPPTAYLWLAQICAEHDITEVRAWAQKAVEKFPLKIFSSQAELIQELKNRGINVYVVSASVQWAVAAAIEQIGLPLENALGVKTKVMKSIVTTEQDGPVTWREGKMEAFRLISGQQNPLLASGNTSGDEHLLKNAKVALAVQSQNTHQPEHPKLLEDELRLQHLAQTHHWLRHHFNE